jgi:hypothetical protein
LVVIVQPFDPETQQQQTPTQVFVRAEGEVRAIASEIANPMALM